MRKSMKVVLRRAIGALTISAITDVVQHPAQAARSKCLSQHVGLYENNDFTGGFLRCALATPVLIPSSMTMATLWPTASHLSITVMSFEEAGKGDPTVTVPQSRYRHKAPDCC
jgi:hypothetical protein